MPTVLVIEDNAVNLRLLTSVLRHGGYDVKSAQTAIEGLAIASAAPPNLVLMDIQLPDIDGLEATARLKADPKTANVPVVAVTAHAMKGDAQRFLNAGCAAYVAKPIRYKELLTVVAEVLGAQGA